MTMPVERVRAVDNTRAFLVRLLNPRETPRVPRAVRQEAARLLRHYPYRAWNIVEDALRK